MSTAARLVKLVEGLDANGVLSAAKGGTGTTTGASVPTISAIAYGDDDTATAPVGGATITLTGTNFAAGAKVLINQTQASVVTVVSSTQITFTAPALAAGSYILYVVNTDGSTAIAVPGIQYSGVPAWSTAAGSLGSSYETTAVSTTVSATSDSAVSYSVVSGTLPAGVTVNSSGTISGTSPATASSTTYTFTVRATDLQNQDTDRQFSLTINPDVVTWSSSATVALQQDLASTTTLAATSAAGQAVSYSVNTLPAGLTLSGAVVSGTPTTVGTTTTTATATAAVTGKTAQQTITWTVSIATDAYWKYNTLLLNGETTVTPFLTDSSTNNFALTAFGDARPSSFGPYTPGYYSNYFDGTGDYLTAPSNAAFAFGTGDFTIEGWFYFTGTIGTYQRPWGFSDANDNLEISTSVLRFGGGTQGTLITGTTTLLKNIWYHIAITRLSGVYKMWLNGVQEGGSATNSWNSSARQIGIAAYPTGVDPITGYVSNFRVVKGTALYTAAFTPSTTPLTAVTNTSLLTCQSNSLIDKSTNNLAITKNGDTIVNGFVPFTPNSSYATYGSAYFDGTGDYLSGSVSTTIGSSDFCMEAWGYWTSFNNGTYGAPLISLGGTNSQLMIRATKTASASTTANYYSTNNSNFIPSAGFSSGVSAGTIYLNQWTHIALTRQGSTWRLFVNGSLVSTQTDAASLATAYTSIVIGADTTPANGYMTGWVTDARIVVGSAIYTAAFTPPTTPLTAVTNTSLLTCQTNQPHTNSQFVDNSTLNGLITRVGNTTQGTFSPYGANWSNYFDGTGDNLTYTGGTTTTLSGDFTLECWVYLNNLSANQPIICIGDGFNVGALFFIDTTGKLRLYANNVQVLTGTGTVAANTWNHVAFVRSGTTITAYLNGVAGGTATSSSQWSGTTTYIGKEIYNTGTGIQLAGYLSNLRLVKGTAVYTTNFTPSTIPLTAIANTSLLTCQSPNFVDNSINNFALTRNGDTSTQKFSPFSLQYPTAQAYSANLFTSGSIQIAHNTANSQISGSLGTGAFTVEGWYYPTTTLTGKNARILSYGRDSAGSNTSWDLYISNGTSLVWNRINTTATTYSGNYTFNTNTWYHLVACRDSSGNFALFVNGTRVFFQASETTDYSYISGSQSNHYIGASYNGTTWSYALGYYSNIRVIKTATAYNPTQSTLTVPTQPLTATAQTIMLLLSSNAGTDITGNYPVFDTFMSTQIKATTFSPFNIATASSEYVNNIYGGSMYFDGTGDYLALPTANTYLIGAGNFTIECWVYKRSTTFDTILSYSSTGGLRIFVNSTGGLELWIGATSQWSVGSVIASNSWTHIVFQRKGTTITGYVNGVAVGTATVSTDYNAGTLNIGGEGTGNPWGGNIADLRIIKGQALYPDAFLPPQAPLQPTTNTILLINGDKAAVVDKSGKNTLETVGDAKISTSVKKYGSASLYFDGTGDQLYSAATSHIANFGTGDFTVEFWIYLNTVPTNTAGILSTYTSGNFYINFRASGTIALTDASTVYASTASALTAGSWFHIAVVRSSGSSKIYTNGVGGTAVACAVNWSTPSLTYIGSDPNGTINGYIDDLRVTKGYARYTANFTPPAQALFTK